MENKKKGLVIISIVAIILLFIGIYFLFIFKYSCEEEGCFKGNLEECVRTEYTKSSNNTLWEYTIEGKENERCKVNAKVLSVKKDDSDRKVLEGKSMDCYLQLGSIDDPISDLSRCHGRLKEEIQGLMIKELHRQIRENLGEVQKSFQEIVE